MKNQMKKFYKLSIYLLISFILPVLLFAQPSQRFAHLGNFKLESGKVIKDCVVGYRTCGKLNLNKSNVILYPAWFGGTSYEMLSTMGKSGMADSTKYFIVAIDALGNGVSSSPSNSKYQPNAKFPELNIRDMVNSEYLLATKTLGLKHVLCVMGSSMGGMQIFQWIVSYPNFMDKAIAIVGSPKLTSNDLLLWNAELLTIKEGLGCNASEESIKNAVVAIHILNLQTPDYFVKHLSPEDFPKFLKDTENHYSKFFNTYNWKCQLVAMINQNVSALFNNSMTKAAAVVKAKVLIIPSMQDHMVNPNPAIEFAKLINVKPLVLNDDCGHFASGCEAEKVDNTINKFLSGH